jgi:hypothetical protein
MGEEIRSVAQRATAAFLTIPQGIMENFPFIIGFGLIEGVQKWATGTLYEDVDPFVEIQNENDPSHQMKVAAGTALGDLFRFAFWDGFSTTGLTPIRKL